MPTISETHDFRVGLNGDRKFYSVIFEAGGYPWQLRAYMKGKAASKSLHVFLFAADEPFFRPRLSVKFSITVASHAAPSKSVTKVHGKCHYVSAKRYHGFNSFMSAEQLENPASALLDASHHLKIVLSITQKDQKSTAPSWSTPPEKSLGGDARISLDDGSCLSAHSLYLQHASEVFSDVLACSSEQPSASTDSQSRATRATAKRRKTDLMEAAMGPPKLKLPLPGTSRKQALLLLHCLYAWTRETAIHALEPPELVELARVADRFSCSEALQLADSALVKMCEGEEKPEDSESSSEDEREPDDAGRRWLNVEDAPAQHQLAGQLHLTGFQACVGRFMGMHAHDMDLAKVDASIAAVLQGARKCRRF